jgi:hypothetical protein
MASQRASMIIMSQRLNTRTLRVLALTMFGVFAFWKRYDQRVRE